jgi:hypothetical protein
MGGGGVAKTLCELALFWRCVLCVSRAQDYYLLTVRCRYLAYQGDHILNTCVRESYHDGGNMIASVLKEMSTHRHGIGNGNV